MTLQHAIWTVGPTPAPLASATLPSEQALEEMIVAAPKILSDSWMLIGQQERTAHGGRIDLLAIAPDGGLVLIEIKRDRTPRDVVAQALDYASWVETLQADDIVAIYGRFAPGRSLAEDFLARFGAALDEDQLNSSHQIVIVAASLDADSERIVAYLGARDIAINVLCFQVFGHGAQQLLSRVWLLDPVQVQAEPKPAAGEPHEPWNGEFYASFGDGPTRSWADAVKYGFVSAGGASWYSKSLGLLNAGDRIWVKAPDHGFVGVGIVAGAVEPSGSFRVKLPDGATAPVLEVAKGATYHREDVDDPEKCEYFVPVTWLQTVPLDKAVKEVGLFGNQNTVCRPTTSKWRTTVTRLKARFPGFEKPSTPPDSGPAPS